MKLRSSFRGNVNSWARGAQVVEEIQKFKRFADVADENIQAHSFVA